MFNALYGVVLLSRTSLFVFSLEVGANLNTFSIKMPRVLLSVLARYPIGRIYFNKEATKRNAKMQQSISLQNIQE